MQDNKLEIWKYLQIFLINVNARVSLLSLGQFAVFLLLFMEYMDPLRVDPQNIRFNGIVITYATFL